MFLTQCRLEDWLGINFLAAFKTIFTFYFYRQDSQPILYFHSGIMSHMLRTNRTKWDSSCWSHACFLYKCVYLLQTHIHCYVSLDLLSFNLQWFTNRGMKYDPVQHFCLAYSPPHIRTSPRLPAGNRGFQGQRLNSSFWLCWWKGLHWFSSSLFLVQGCKRGTESSHDGSCQS